MSPDIAVAADSIISVALLTLAVYGGIIWLVFKIVADREARRGGDSYEI